MLGDPGVVPGRERRGAGALRKGEQLSEAEAAVAADARVGRLAARVAAHERLDDGASELVAKIERHVGKAELVAGAPGGEHRLGRAAGALRVRSVGVEPEAKRDADRLRPRPQQRHGAVDAAAHRDGHALGIRLGPKDATERVGERVDGQLVPADSGRLEQRQAFERALDPRCVRRHDAIAVHRQTHERELHPARGVSEHLDHRPSVAATAAGAGSARTRSQPRSEEAEAAKSRISIAAEKNSALTLPMIRARVNLAKPGGCRQGRSARRLDRIGLPVTECWFYMDARSTNGVGRRVAL